MTTSSSTTAEPTTCPPWCQRTDHDADEVGPGFPPVHYGPEFGAVGTQSDGFTTEAVTYFGAHDAVYVSDPDELRRIAADMVRAADWIEEHR
jgi:hypothetical protein